jgi:hypothetical protein
MKRLLIANLIIGTFISVQANAATQIDNAPHGNPLSLFSTKDMGSNVKRATYGVKWKDGAMTYTNIELVCGENKARDIGYSDDGTGTVWKDRSNDLYNGKKHYDLVKGSIQSNVYRAVCKVAVPPVTEEKSFFTMPSFNFSFFNFGNKWMSAKDLIVNGDTSSPEAQAIISSFDKDNGRLYCIPKMNGAELGEFRARLPGLIFGGAFQGAFTGNFDEKKPMESVLRLAFTKSYPCK